MNYTAMAKYCFNHLKHSGNYMHLLEPCNASLNSLMTRTEMGVKTLVYSSYQLPDAAVSLRNSYWAL